MKNKSYIWLIEFCLISILSGCAYIPFFQHETSPSSAQEVVFVSTNTTIRSFSTETNINKRVSKDVTYDYKTLPIYIRQHGTNILIQVKIPSE